MEEYRLTLRTAAEETTAVVDDQCNLLEAMRGAGLSVRKSCRNGVCGLCKCGLAEGEISYLWRQPHGLWQKHLDDGLILPCIAFARSDLTLDRIPLVEEGG